VTLESLLESDFTGARDFESFFGTRICFNLWHLMMRFLNDTLLADLLWQTTYGAIWAIPVCNGTIKKWSAKVYEFLRKRK
jgi:hypothetical protein